MAIDQWGRVIPDYPINYPNYSNLYSTNSNYRDELLKQKEAIDYRLSEFDKRNQPPQQPQVQATYADNTSVTPQSPKRVSQPYIMVDSEQEAIDYPIINSINDEIGKVHLFATKDDKTIIAKRINPANFEAEKEFYDKRPSTQSEKTIDSHANEGELLISIDERLKKIEQIVDMALTMLPITGTNNSKKPNNSTVDKTTKKQSDESEAK